MYKACCCGSNLIKHIKKFLGIFTCLRVRLGVFCGQFPVGLLVDLFLQSGPAIIPDYIGESEEEHWPNTNKPGCNISYFWYVEVKTTQRLPDLSSPASHPLDSAGENRASSPIDSSFSIINLVENPDYTCIQLITGD